MDYLEYFISATEDFKKTAYLVLMTSRPNVGALELQAEDLRGAVLLYEYRILGFRSSLFTTCDFNGNRTVIAPAALRGQVFAAVCRYLMEHGAQVILISLQPGSAENCQIWF
jgi:hypothetical protein